MSVVRLGDRVRDKVTGFKGIVTCYQKHITGCDSVWVLSETVTTQDGKPVERHLDVHRAELVQAGAVRIEQENPSAG